MIETLKSVTTLFNELGSSLKMIETLKSVTTLFNEMEDLSLGFTPSQIELVESKVKELEALSIEGKEEEIASALNPCEKQNIIRAYCFTRLHKGHKYLFLRK